MKLEFYNKIQFISMQAASTSSFWTSSKDNASPNILDTTIQLWTMQLRVVSQENI